MSFLAAGLDPGKDGALVALAVDPAAGSVQVFRVIRTKDLLHSGRGAPYNLQAMREAIAGLHDRPPPSNDAIGEITFVPADRLPLALVVIERQQSRLGPGLGRLTMFTMGQGYGLWLGLLAGLQVPFQEVTPAVWTRRLLDGAPGAGKERTAAFVSQALPDLAGAEGATVRGGPGRATRLHQGVADAAALGLYGVRYALRGGDVSPS